MDNNTVKDFKNAVKNFHRRLEKYKSVRGATFSQDYYEIENEINSALSNLDLIDKRKLRGLTTRLNNIKQGTTKKSMIIYYSPEIDTFQDTPSKYNIKTPYKHDLYTIDDIIPDNPVIKDTQSEPLFLPDEYAKSEEQIRSEYERFDSALLHEVWEWVSIKPQGIAFEIKSKIEDMIVKYDEKSVAEMLNNASNRVPDLNNQTNYDSLEDLRGLFEQIDYLLELDLEAQKMMSDEAELYEEF